ncbi:MAG: TVP38/TMEM64 family protein [Gammaproteobacteria bacterium]
MTTKTVSARQRLLVGGAILAMVLVGVFALPLEEWLGKAHAWRLDHPAPAAALYVIAITLATPLMLPGSVLMMTGGFLFGAIHGAVLALTGITAGATVACLAGRSVARPAIAQWTRDNAQFRALDSALAQRGFLVVMLTRLSLLIPFNVLNYAYGVTSVRLRTFIVATGLGMIPAVILFGYLGSLAGDVDALLDSDASSGPTGKVIIAVGVIALIAATYVIHRTATRELKKHMAAQKSPAK